MSVLLSYSQAPIEADVSIALSKFLTEDSPIICLAANVAIVSDESSKLTETQVVRDNDVETAGSSLNLTRVITTSFHKSLLKAGR